jgi:hypothetical protein
LSYSTITEATRDQGLLDRVIAAVAKEANDNPDLSGTDFGAFARSNPLQAGNQLMYPVAIDTEAAYESALANGRGAPGHDSDVITDAALLASVQSNWPPNAPA